MFGTPNTVSSRNRGLRSMSLLSPIQLANWSMLSFTKMDLYKEHSQSSSTMSSSDAMRHRSLPGLERIAHCRLGHNVRHCASLSLLEAGQMWHTSPTFFCYRLVETDDLQ